MQLLFNLLEFKQFYNVNFFKEWHSFNLKIYINFNESQDNGDYKKLNFPLPVKSDCK